MKETMGLMLLVLCSSVWLVATVYSIREHARDRVIFSEFGPPCIFSDHPECKYPADSWVHWLEVTQENDINAKLKLLEGAL